MSAIKPLNLLLGRIARVAVAIAGAAIVCMALVEAWQVFARYVMNDSPSWTEPVALLLMSTAMMFGAAAGVRGNRHFGFFLLLDQVNPGVRRALIVLARTIAAAVGLMLSGWGARMLSDSWDFPMAGAPLPQGMVFLPVCIGGALIALFAIEQIVSPPAPETGE
jgi:TRAP-type C4-dicarboxylate transport system permease small subunit